MMRVALGMILAMAATACASTTTLVPQPVPDAERLTQATDPTTGEVGTDVIAVSHEGTPAQVGNPQWLGAAGGSEFVLTGGQDQFVGVWVDVPKAQKRAHVPMSITLTIDTSGSMSGEKITRARDAAKAMVNGMKNGDLIAIHRFDGSAHEMVAPTVLDSHSRMMVLGTIAELEPGGATNMFEALDLAIRRARSAPATHPVRRVVMISDGRATAGPTSTHTLAQQAENGVPFGVQVTALGVGLDYDENTLNALAMRSSGRLFHLSDPKEMSGIVQNELALLQGTMATNAIVEIVPAPGVTLLGTSQGVRSAWAQDGGQRALRIELGTMFAGQRRELLVRYRLHTDEVEGKKAIVSARLHFTDPSDGGVARVQEVVVRGELTSDPKLVASHQNANVQAIIAMQDAASLTLAARANIDAGNWDDADMELAKAEQALRQRAQHAKSQKERQRMSSAAEGIASSRRSVKKAAQAPPSAAPAARRSESLKLNDQAMDAYGL